LRWQRTGLTIDNYQSVGRSFRMPRPLRIEYPGAIYHIMNRGDRREDIFKDDSDREVGGERIETSAEGRSGQSGNGSTVAQAINHEPEMDRGPTPNGKLELCLKPLA